MKKPATGTAAPRAKPGLEASLTVADDIQLMQLGRIMAVGLYPDRVIVVHHAAEVPIGSTQISRLSLLLTVRGLPAGRHLAESTILFPNGKGQLDSRGAPISVQAERPINLMMAFAPFPVAAPGEFKLRVRVSGFEVEVSFWIVYRDLTSELAAMTPPPVLHESPPVVDRVPPKSKTQRAAKTGPKFGTAKRKSKALAG